MLMKKGNRRLKLKEDLKSYIQNTAIDGIFIGRGIIVLSKGKRKSHIIKKIEEH